MGIFALLLISSTGGIPTETEQSGKTLVTLLFTELVCTPSFEGIKAGAWRYDAVAAAARLSHKGKGVGPEGTSAVLQNRWGGEDISVPDLEG